MRELTKIECEDTLVHLLVAWDVNQHYWYPLRREDPFRNDIVAFYEPFFEKCIGDVFVRQILRDRNIDEIIEIREGGSGTAMPITEFEIYYSGLEAYWTSPPFDWLIYASHESSVTFAGDWLVSQVKSKYVNWEQGIYVSPFVKDYQHLQ